MKKQNYITLVLLLLFLATQSIYSQTAVAQLSSKQVAVGQQFEFSIVVNASPTGYGPPDFKGLEVLGGPNTSNSMQWVNGQTSVQTTLSWILRATREGKYVIGPVLIVIGGQRIEAQAVTVEVLKGQAQVTQQGQNPQQQDAKGAQLGGGDLFIRTSVSKPKCYIGEQITIIQKVYCRLQIMAFQKFAQPTYDGFYSQALESPNRGQLSVENIDGINYYTYELFRTQATASQAGKVNITPIEGDVVVRRQTNVKPRNIFEQFFGATGYEDTPVTTKSRPVAVDVMPLPEDGKPEGFNGAVGNFNARIELSRKEMKADEAFNLKMIVSGKGNLKLINPPELKLPDGFETYEPKTTENAGAKIFEYPVIPRREGEFVIDNLNFSYFNLDTKKYVVIPFGELKVKVLPADPNRSGGAQVYTPHNQVKETENDIRYIKKGQFNLAKTQTEFFNSGTHIAFLSLSLLGLAAGLFIRRNHLKNNSNLAIVRERKAARAARKQLALAEKLMQQNNKDEFYTEILNALNNYLGHKLHIPVAELSRETIQKILVQKQTDETLLAKLFSTLDTGEYAKYAPAAVSGDLKAVFEDTINLVTSLEQHLNKKA